MKNINQNSFSKFVFYISLFTLICTLLFFYIIVPSLDSYKIKNSQLNISIERYEDLLHKYKISQNNLKFQKELIQFDEKVFLDFAKKYFDKISLVKDEKKDNSINYKFSISTDNLNNFYDFIDNLGDFKNIVKFEYPLLINFNKNNIELDICVKIVI